MYVDITEFVVAEDYLSPQCSPTRNEVISTYISPDVGDFVFISYKREVYGQTEHQQMP